MRRTVQITADGSPTIAIDEIGVTYRSRHGAMQESMLVFISAGLDFVRQHTTGTVRIFEMGLGTGLNALLTLQRSQQNDFAVYYFAVERFPLSADEWMPLNYGEVPGLQAAFRKIHEAEWEEDVSVTGNFILHKTATALDSVELNTRFDLVYFDAFAPAAQPELWTTAVFGKMYALLNPGGVLVTYCSKSEIRRAMQAAGFTVEKLPGPKGKREIVRARR